MEATGVYWKPVWHVLEEHFTLVLASVRLEYDHTEAKRISTAACAVDRSHSVSMVDFARA
jgi:hypothetical protein